ncbi:MAG TPA: hypothetical protein VFK05_28640 [Polyangiaceae bacterium]|nr:hypothetical protein [Polyangiaceae bacterium]
MTVSIPCEKCARPIGLAESACLGCGRPVTRDERAALEERFAATNSDYRDARTTVARALTVSLVSGLLTIAIVAIVFLLARMASDVDESAPILETLAPLVAGATMVAMFFVGKHEPILALAVVTTLWFAALAAPFALSPLAGVLAMMSPVGLALALARIGVLLLLLQALPSAWRLEHLRTAVRNQ